LPSEELTTGALLAKEWQVFGHFMADYSIGSPPFRFSIGFNTRFLAKVKTDKELRSGVEEIMKHFSHVKA